MSLVYRVAGIHSAASFWLALLMNVVLFAATVPAVRRLADRLGGSPRLAGWLWALVPISGYTPAAYVWSTSLFTLAFAWTLIAIIDLPEASSRRWAWTGAACGAVAWIDPAGLVPCLLAILVVGVGARPAWRPVLAIMMALAAMAPWIVRNSVTFGRPTYLRDNAGLEVWYGIREARDGDTYLWSPSRNPAEAAHLAAIGEAAYFDEKRAAAIDVIRAEPGHFAALSLARWGKFWLGGYRVRELGWGFIPAIVRRLAWAALPILAVVGWRRRLAGRSALMMALALAFIAFSLPYAFVLVDPRYRVPLEPLLFALTSCAFNRRYRSNLPRMVAA